MELPRVLAKLPGSEGVAIPSLRPEHLMRPESRDWEPLKRLYDELQRTGTIPGSPDQLDLVRRVARQVAIPDEVVERELHLAQGLSNLITEERKRIREGSRRLMQAMSEAERRVAIGDRAGARQVFQDALSREVVPFYREIAEEEARALEEPHT